MLSFNKRREDFADLRTYNDYLQGVEDISTWTRQCNNLL